MDAAVRPAMHAHCMRFRAAAEAPGPTASQRWRIAPFSLRSRHCALSLRRRASMPHSLCICTLAARSGSPTLTLAVTPCAVESVYAPAPQTPAPTKVAARRLPPACMLSPSGTSHLW